MSNRDRVLRALACSIEPLDDDELARRAGIAPRQTVNILCRALAGEGVLDRVQGSNSKIVNQLRRGPERSVLGDSPARSTSTEPLVEPFSSLPVSSGDSSAQRRAEVLMLRALSDRLGIELSPRRIYHPSGARVEIDGADAGLGVLVECWAHQGPAKVAQKYKLVVDATKLGWIARSLAPAPTRLILCVSDPAAVSHLNGSSWQAQAIRELGVEIEVVTLEPAIVANLAAAQQRQYR